MEIIITIKFNAATGEINVDSDHIGQKVICMGMLKFAEQLIYNYTPDAIIKPSGSDIKIVEGTKQ